jgi:dephospho-CoA kinase
LLVARALLLTGVAGVGKSTVADAIGRTLTGTGRPTAVVDADQLAQFGPPPSVANFYDELKCANLRAVWANFAAAGARFVVVSTVVATMAERARYAGSLVGCDVQVVRLTADPEIVRARLRARDSGAKLDRHLRALADQPAALDASHVADFAVANDRSADLTAREILLRAGWA